MKTPAALFRAAGVPLERLAMHMARYGNISAAGTLVLLAEDIESGAVELGSGQLVLFAAIGAGGSAGTGVGCLLLTAHPDSVRRLGRQVRAFTAGRRPAPRPEPRAQALGGAGPPTAGAPHPAAEDIPRGPPRAAEGPPRG